MVVKSHGPRRGTRKKMRSRKKTGITKYLKEFEVGQSVSINIEPSAQKYPSIKFQGVRGTVVSKKGSSYCVEIKDKNALKKIFVKPEHLKAIN